MSKTLTEQWREGTLEQRYYYVKYFENGQKPFVEIELKNFLLDLVKVKDSDKIEVLSAVPSYKEYNKLRKLPLKCFQLEEDNSTLMVINKDMCKEKERIEKKLEIATKALKEYAEEENWDDCSTGEFGSAFSLWFKSAYKNKHFGYNEAKEALGKIKELDK